MSYIDNPSAAGGGSPADASYVTGAAEAGLSAELVLGPSVIMRGLLAARPAAATAGRLYFVTDAGSERWSRDTGAAWENAGPGWDFVTSKPSTFAPAVHDLAGADHSADTLANLNGKVSDVDLAAHAGDIAGGTPAAPALPNGTVTFAKMQDIASDRLMGRDSAGSGDPEELAVGGNLEFDGAGAIRRAALTGDVTAAAGSGATAIAAAAVLSSMLRNSAAVSVIGRGANSVGVPADLAAGDGEFLRRVGATLAFGTILFSRGGTLLDPTGARNVIVWRAPIACTVTNVRGYRVGGTGATINARRNGSDNHLSSALSLTSADAWADGGAVQNTAYAAGDKMEIMLVSVAGTPTEIAVLVDLTRP